MKTVRQWGVELCFIVAATIGTVNPAIHAQEFAVGDGSVFQEGSFCRNADLHPDAGLLFPNGFIDEKLAEHFPKASSPFSLNTLYTADLISNTRGGNRTGNAYSALLDVVLTTDLDAIGLGAIGGKFVVHGQNSHGPALGRFVGATQSNNIDSEPFTKVAEYFWERELFDDTVLVRIGRQVGAHQFSVLDVAADFLYGGFQISPNNPLPWYPVPTVGATTHIRIADSFDIGAGVFAGGTPTSWGWSDDGSVYSVVEFTYHYDLGGRPGDIQNGFWYTSSDSLDVFGGTDHDSNNGYYFGANQMLSPELSDPTQGLAAFFIYSWAVENRTQVNRQYAGGLVYRGLLPGHDADVVGLGFSTADFSNEVTNPESETVVETFYKTYLNGTSILIEPAIQYIANPSGTQGDSLTAGVRLGFEL